jgi:hypothetical protein
LTPATKTVLILTAGAFAGLVGTLVGRAVGGENPALGLGLGLGLGLALQAVVTYQVVKA